MEDNQCDGCKRGLAVKDKIHFEKDGKPYIGCSSSLYEKSHRPSDLEIVQNALDISGRELELGTRRRWWLYEKQFSTDTVASGNDTESLLTWAKQTVADRCPSHDSEQGGEA